VNDRALAGWIIIEFAGLLLLTSLLWGVLNEVVLQFDSVAPPASTTANIDRGQSWVRTAWDWAPLWVSAAATIALQARANFESRGGAA